MKPVILDLFCGAGGAAVGYHRAGFDVIGVDIADQPNYPFPFHQADAIEYLTEALDKFCPFNYVDAIHASPPCQRWSAKTKNKDAHPDLIAPLRLMLEEIASEGVPYVIENVPGAPLNDPVQLCGSSFGLGVRRHRLFETSFPLLAPPCDHASQPKKYRIYDHGRWYMSSVVHMFGTGGGKAKEHWAEASGIDWMTHKEMAEAIPPAYTKHIGHQLMAQILRSNHGPSASAHDDRVPVRTRHSETA